jgi:glycosyltransferase involved in cell wall biosynthesis
MRIAHYYADVLEEGGCPSNVRNLSQAQLALGHEVLGFGFSGGSPERIPNGFSVATFPRTPLGLRKLIREMTRPETAPEVLTVWGTLVLGNEIVLRETHRSGIPTVLSPQGHLEPFLYSHGRRFLKRSYKRLAIVPQLRHWVTDVHAQSPYEASLARGLGFRGRTHVFPLGTPGKVPPPKRPGPLRQALGIGSKEVVAGFFGRFDPVQKRFDALLAGIRRCKALAEAGEVRFVMAGKGSEEQVSETRRLIDRHDLTQLVGMVGPFNGEARFGALGDLDVLLHPSQYEALPRVIREAASVGTPAIVSVQANAELLADAGGALLSEPNPEALERAITFAVRDEAWRTTASRSARAWAEENDWTACARNFAGIYDRALEALA